MFVSSELKLFCSVFRRHSMSEQSVREWSNLSTQWKWSYLQMLTEF